MSTSNGRVDVKQLIREKAAERKAALLQAERARLSDALVAEFDRLNSVWTEKEAELVALHVPHEVTYLYEDLVTEHGPEARFYLGLVKGNGGRWRLCHGISAFVGRTYDCISWKPIVECSLDYRVSCVRHFEALRDRVITAAEDSIKNVQDAIAALQKA